MMVLRLGLVQSITIHNKHPIIQFQSQFAVRKVIIYFLLHPRQIVKVHFFFHQKITSKRSLNHYDYVTIVQVDKDKTRVLHLILLLFFFSARSIFQFVVKIYCNILSRYVAMLSNDYKRAEQLFQTISRATFFLKFENRSIDV